MLLEAEISYTNFVRGLFEDTDAEILHVDDLRRGAELALQGHVVQLYPPAWRDSGNFNTWRCMFDVAAPSQDEAHRFVGPALRALQPSTRDPSAFTRPRTEWIPGLGHGRVRVSFDMRTKRA